jgi:hypothetical protein
MKPGEEREMAVLLNEVEDNNVILLPFKLIFPLPVYVMFALCSSMLI